MARVARYFRGSRKRATGTNFYDAIFSKSAFYFGVSAGAASSFSRTNGAKSTAVGFGR
ncbi:MAG: hypothetical protein AVDCRST_MAG56-3231 [uncultured Cytophagales bacterium]|uniref:Uncharacterized protein n=1 Tax=uncultured Cytophagales bacterium TaxID=158755 RepID=A0A6J4JCP0_9SPHI|nr:MAG: hypothetical protein AVDCRST_MAG56-3231 [uncultured Cytophagales bacterium]